MSLPDQGMIDFAEKLADAAREHALKHFRNIASVDRKADASPVTIADHEIEAVLRGQIAATYPDHGIVGEELGETNADRPWAWVIDPIDGTKSFATGKPTFGTLIALMYESEPQLGIIEHPALDERWLGVKGRRSECCRGPCQTRTTEHLSDATLYATTVDMFSGRESAIFEHVSRQVNFRCFGADCYAYGLLASGLVDIVMEADLKPHDFIALVPVVEGAGGCITDWEGKPLRFESTGQVLASANLTLHSLVLEHIRGVAQ